MAVIVFAILVGWPPVGRSAGAQGPAKPVLPGPLPPEPKPTEPAYPAGPPVLRPVRWQYLDGYDDAFIDGSGRPWFVIVKGPRNISPPPERVLVCPGLPGDSLDLANDSFLLGFDSRDRFWEVTKYDIGCTDVRTGKFTEHRAAPGVSRDRWPKDGKSIPKEQYFHPTFAASMLEHSTGKLFFVDAFGMHVLDGDRWSYLEFSPPLARPPRGAASGWGHHFFHMTEGPCGRVFVWENHERSSGVLGGFWVHDGARLKLYSFGKHPNVAGLQTLVPRADGSVLVRHQVARDFVIQLYPEDRGPAPAGHNEDRWKAIQAQPPQGPDAKTLAEISGEELAGHGSVVGRDREGRAYVKTREWVPVNVYNTRILVFDPRYPEDGPTLKYQCFAMDRRVYHSHAAAVDSRGRVWARLAVDRHPFLSCYEKDRWIHYPDPTAAPGKESPPAPGGASSRATAGRPVLFEHNSWVMVPDSVKGGNWFPRFPACKEGLPGMADPGLIRPLREGRMLAAQKRLVDTGLKIVPVRPAPGGPALLPSRENVLSGKYPYCDYLLVAVRPDAPEIVRRFHAFLKEAALAEKPAGRARRHDAVRSGPGACLAAEGTASGVVRRGLPAIAPFYRSFLRDDMIVVCVTRLRVEAVPGPVPAARPPAGPGTPAPPPPASPRPKPS